MIDLHCHILPNIDDGSRSLEESLSMAKRAVEDGIQTIVATPHTLNGVYSNSVPEVVSRVAELQGAFQENGIDLRLCPGADVHLSFKMLEKIERGDAGTINDKGSYLLLEIPFQNIPTGIKEEIFALKLNGITPIITHPERHPFVHHNPGILREFVELGALCQITAMSVTGEFGKAVRKCSEALIRQRLIHVIASDAHSSDARPPVLSQAVEAAAEIMGNYEEAERMVESLPAAILSGEKVEVPEPARAGKT